MPFQTPPNFVAGAVLTEAQLDILSENETFLANPPKCRVFHSAAISTTNGTDKVLTFDSERFDTDTMHSAVTNPSRITFTTAGTYLIGANIEVAANTAGFRNLKLRLNGTTSIGELLVPPASASSRLSVSTLYAFAATDFVEVVVHQTSGVALDVLATAAFSPEFFAVWVSL